MYKPHPAFVVPSNPKSTIWRFLRLEKLIYILERRALYFARGDRFEDPLEGMLTDHIASNIKSAGDDNLRMYHQAHLSMRYDTYVNCWHINDVETAEMWSGRDVAIQSDFSSLTRSIVCAKDVKIGRVCYDDQHLRSDTMPNIFAFWLYKRPQFAYEKEVRALVNFPRTIYHGSMVYQNGKWRVVDFPVMDASTPLAIDVEIDPSILIHRIVVSPTAKSSMLKDVCDAVAKYGYSFPVDRSGLRINVQRQCERERGECDG